MLLNGVPGRHFACKLGLDKVIPCPPLLFVLDADLLQTIVNYMHQKGLLHQPIPYHDKDYPIVQYADDTLLIVPADDDQLLALKSMLLLFSQSTGLKVNYHKSSMLPINVDNVELTRLPEVFGCQVGSLPFTYFGLPVGTSRPKIADLMPLVDSMEFKLSANSSFLAYGGRLRYLNSALSSLPIFFLCSLSPPLGILKQLERIQRQCLWRWKRDEPAPSLAVWKLICRSKKKGGLGIMNLGVQNVALLLKHVNKFYNKVNVHWVIT